METPVDYDQLDDALRRCGAGWDASQAHGLLALWVGLLKRDDAWGHRVCRLAHEHVGALDREAYERAATVEGFGNIRDWGLHHLRNIAVDGTTQSQAKAKAA